MIGILVGRVLMHEVCDMAAAYERETVRQAVKALLI